MLAENTHDKYRKNRKNNKFNKNQDLEKEEAKKGPEMYSNIAKNHKSNKDFSCQLKTPMTNIAKIAKITNVTRIKAQKEKKPRRAPKCPQMWQKRRSNKDFSW